MRFQLILELFGILLGGLRAVFWHPLGAFGLLWASPWLPLAPILELQQAIQSLFSAMDLPWAVFGPPFGSLWVLLASFGAHLGSLWLPFWTFRTPCQAFSPPWTDLGGAFPHLGSFLGLLVITFGCFWGLFGIPWLSFWASSCQLNLLVFARLSPDECWRVPAESKRIL